MQLTFRPLAELGEIAPGTDLGALIAAGVPSLNGAVVVISQKAVSKAEGRIVELASVEPGERALALGAELGKNPRLVELILSESARVVRAERGVLIVETRSGHVCANAGIDASNVPGEDTVALLPEDSDASARRIRDQISAAAGPDPAPAVVIADSFGRPWRNGQVDVAIGCAGIDPLDDWRGRSDREGRRLASTLIAVADALAAAADLARTKVSGTPVVIVDGLGHLVTAEHGPRAAALRRVAENDLFR
jgi:coenzyme F420-0:L-glutamate ligase/coenzyme F420-1:gamma-L-glutamate ligase